MYRYFDKNFMHWTVQRSIKALTCSDYGKEYGIVDNVNLKAVKL